MWYSVILYLRGAVAVGHTLAVGLVLRLYVVSGYTIPEGSGRGWPYSGCRTCTAPVCGIGLYYTWGERSRLAILWLGLVLRLYVTIPEGSGRGWPYSGCRTSTIPEGSGRGWPYSGCRTSTVPEGSGRGWPYSGCRTSTVPEGSGRGWPYSGCRTCTAPVCGSIGLNYTWGERSRLAILWL